MKKKGKYGKLIVITVILLNVIFAYRVLDVFEKVGSEPVAMVSAWFAFTTGELWLLKDIKKTKDKKKEDNQNGSD